jgi:type II secretory pathway pseudopilin PulG
MESNLRESAFCRGRESVLAWACSRARRLRSDAGFTIVEMLVATAVLVAISAPISAVLITAAKSAAMSRSRSSADELAAAKIELIRAMPYDNIGFPGGNPPGTLQTTNQLFFAPTTLNGDAISIGYQISYVDDHGAKTQTYADYKRITVTITRTRDNAVLASKTTNVSSLTGAPGGGSEYVTIRRLVVDMASGAPPLPGVTVSLASGPSAPRRDMTNSAGSVIFPTLTVNPNASNFYDVTASLGGYSTYPADLPYAGTASPAISREHVNHLVGADDLQTLQMYKNGSAVTVNVYRSDGRTPFGSPATVYMGAGLAGNSVAASSGAQTTATITSLMLGLGSAYITPAVPTISIFPGNYTFAAQYGTAASMTYSAPQSVGVPNNYPVDLSKVVNLVMGSTAVTSNASVTVTVRRGTSPVQDAHVEISSTATGVPAAPSVYVWGNTNSGGTATLIVPRGVAYTVRATDARGSTASVSNQSFNTATPSVPLTITP